MKSSHNTLKQWRPFQRGRSDAGVKWLLVGLLFAPAVVSVQLRVPGRHGQDRQCFVIHENAQVLSRVRSQVPGPLGEVLLPVRLTENQWRQVTVSRKGWKWTSDFFYDVQSSFIYFHLSFSMRLHILMH